MPFAGPAGVLASLGSRSDPMERSALALAVGDPAAALANGEMRAAGIVTAREIVGLDLVGTEVVVLAACDSGRGDIVALDGTHGLSRAFRAAGARCVISSFWPVSDRLTPELMHVLYRELAAGTSPSTALSRANREIRRISRHPRHWAAFFAYGPPGEAC